MRRIQDVLFVAGVAVLTALVAGPLLGPGVARAVDEAAPPTAPAAQPALVAGGLRLTLAIDGEDHHAGEVPGLTLTAVNTTGEALAADATVRLTTRGSAPAGSRMIPRPREVWTQAVPLSLAPEETRSVRLTLDVALGAGQDHAFEIAVGDQSVLAASIALPAPSLAEEEVVLEEDDEESPESVQPAAPAEVGVEAFVSR